MSTRLAALFVLPACLACGGLPPPGSADRCQDVRASAIPVDRARVLGILTSGSGNLIVRGTDSDSLSVLYSRSASGRACYSPPIETIDKADSLFVTIDDTTTSPIDLQIGMPEDLTLDLRDAARDIIVRNVENRVDVFLHARGSLDFDDIEGPLTIEDGVGPIRIHDVRGPIVIRDDGGGITITEVKNTVNVETGGGDVTITNTGADVELVMGAGRLVVRDVGGSLRYRKTGPGEITITNVTGGVTRQ
jgi:hypothetical protein